MLPSRDKFGRLLFVFVVLAVIAGAILTFVTGFRQEPPPATRHYVGLSWSEVDGSKKARLFSIHPTTAGISIVAGRWSCSATAAIPGEDFTCGGHVFRYEKTPAFDRLISVGIEVPPLGGATIGSGQDATLLVRGPGVAGRHARIWKLPFPHAPCGETDGLCVENEGASGTLAVYTSAGLRSFHPRHRAAVHLSENDELWLGYVPFRVTSVGPAIRLVIIDSDHAPWTSLRGDRHWQGLEMPAWSMRRDSAAGQHDFYAEAALDHLRIAGDGDLAATRVEVQQEETVQTLIDSELLCLDRVDTLTGNVPRLSWRDPSSPGCGGSELRSDVRLAVPPSVERLYRTAWTDRSINRFVAVAARRLQDDPYVDDPTELPLIFDYRFVDTPGGLRRTPVRLLGVRPEVSLHRARRWRETTSADPDIKFASGSDSPRLEVSAVDASLASVPVAAGMELVLATGVNGARREAFVGVGGPIPQAARSWTPPTCLPPTAAPNCGPAVLTLGSAWFGGKRVASLPSFTPTTGGTSASFTVERSGIRTSTTVTPREGHVARNGVEIIRTTALQSGDTLVIGGLTLTYGSAEDIAATSRHYGGGFRRVYPAGRDALQLIGVGSRSAGIEGSLTHDTADRVRRDWKEHKVPLRLTVRADLQHIVARELNAVVDRAIADAQADGETSRAATISGSAVLMNASGDVLAVGNAPTADMEDAEELEQTLMEVQRRHGEGRKAAERRVSNHAFLRALPVGSTQKIATSIAQFRENAWPEQAGTNGCAHHLGGYWIATPRHKAPQLELLGGYDCNGDHGGVLPIGALSAWHEAFRASCDVYFGVAAFALTPGHAWALRRPSQNGTTAPGLSPGKGETALVFDHSDPSVELRPGALDRPVAGDGNAYFETLLLLGFRFSSKFAGRGVNPQGVDDYDHIRYPTADRPWLAGLNAQAFAYPTVAGFRSYTSAYVVGGVAGDVRPVTVAMGPYRLNVVRDQHWVEYLMSGWGQTVAGNSLSIAASALPIVDAGGLMPQPRILDLRPVAGAAAPTAPAPLFDRAALQNAQTELRGALRNVVLHGTAAPFFANSPVRLLVGGKTGTIQIATTDPEFVHAGQPDALRRLFRYGCGVLGVAATPQDWAFGLSEYQRLVPHGPAWATTLPAAGFAEGSVSCAAAFNPGLPRTVMNAARSPDLQSWDAFIAAENGDWQHEKVVSSAFVAVTLAPLAATQHANGDAAGEGWILGVIIDDRVPAPADPVTAKRTAVAILESLQRYLEVRNR